MAAEKMDDDTFRAVMQRQSPQTFSLVNRLCGGLEEALRKSRQFQAGELEVEVMFGRRHPGGGWSNVVSPCAWQHAQTILDNMGVWTAVSDWVLVRDTLTHDGRRIRTGNENMLEIPEMIKKVSLSTTDAAYVPYAPNGGGSSDDNLRDYDLRFNMKFEEPHEAKKQLESFRQVKLSYRKCWTLRSESLPGVAYKYELSMFWLAESMKALDEQMARPGQHCLEIELQFDRNRDMDFQERWSLAESLVSKMQDLMEYQRIFVQPVPNPPEDEMRAFRVLAGATKPKRKKNLAAPQQST